MNPSTKDLVAISMVIAASSSLLASAAGTWPSPVKRTRERPHVKRMVAGSDAEINAWNEAVDKRKAAPQGEKK